MKTIKRTSSVLRRFAIAGLGAATLWTATLAQAAIAPSTPVVLEGLQATVRAPVLPNALPLGKAPLAEPLLVAPSCGKSGCMNNLQAPTASQRSAEPQALFGLSRIGRTGAAEGSSLLLAGGEPPIVVDSCRGGVCRI